MTGQTERIQTAQPGSGLGGMALNPITHATRETVISALAQATGHAHGKTGYPDFKARPHASSWNHQQMHITAIKRAYDAGLRLMFASWGSPEIRLDTGRERSLPLHLARQRALHRTDAGSDAHQQHSSRSSSRSTSSPLEAVYPIV